MHHCSTTAEQIGKGDSPEMVEPHMCQQVRQGQINSKSLPQFVVVWHTLEELCHLMVGVML